MLEELMAIAALTIQFFIERHELRGRRDLANIQRLAAVVYSIHLSGNALGVPETIAALDHRTLPTAQTPVFSPEVIHLLGRRATRRSGSRWAWASPPLAAVPNRVLPRGSPVAIPPVPTPRFGCFALPVALVTRLDIAHLPSSYATRQGFPVVQSIGLPCRPSLNPQRWGDRPYTGVCTGSREITL
jgi:hypothetical protein